MQDLVDKLNENYRCCLGVKWDVDTIRIIDGKIFTRPGYGCRCDRCTYTINQYIKNNPGESNASRRTER